MQTATAHGQLKTGRAGQRTKFAVATSEDEGDLRALLRESPMAGRMRLTFEREPDYFRGENLAGASDETIVARRDGQLLCMGRCSYRRTWVNGAEQMAGYLAELRLSRSAVGHASIIRRGYQFFGQHVLDRSCSVYFTSIASDNGRARRLLESCVPGLPNYSFLGEMTTLLIEVPRRTRPSAVLAERATSDDLPEIMRLLNGVARAHSLATAWDERALLSLATQNLPWDRWRVIRRDGRIVAAAALWDQRPFRQVVINGYSRAMRLARSGLNLTRGLWGGTFLPPAHSVLPVACLCPLAVTPAEQNLVPELVHSLLPLARSLGLEYLSLGFSVSDPSLPLLIQKFRLRQWRSRIYQVKWAELESEPVRGPIRPDLAFL